MTGNQMASLVSLHWDKIQGEGRWISQHLLQSSKVQRHAGIMKYGYNHHRKLNSSKEPE